MCFVYAAKDVNPAFEIYLLVDVNAAIWQALGLFVAHAIHVVRMHAEKRTHSLKAGPGATLNMRATMVWAVLQVTPLTMLSIRVLGLRILSS